MEQPAETSKLRVLVVDDNIDGADALSAVLQAMDCLTAVAYNGPEALNTAATFSPHLAFVDLEMPGMNGRDVVRHLRANHPDRQLRLVCLTGRDLPEDRRLCLEAGFDEFVTKPMEPTALAGMLAAANARL
jgi:CheY-like chemotaxis protein